MKISAYTYCKNPKEMSYPFIESISSFAAIADEIAVLDASDKEDGSKELLGALKQKFENDPNKTFKIIYTDKINWSAKNSGIYDGVAKSIVRSQCTGDYLIQFDLDEILVGTREQIEDMITRSGIDKENPLMSLPVIEPWGSSGKIRCDVNIWKERISINDPNITHGIPISHRKYIDGLLYSHPGSDGCNVIYKNTGTPVPLINFIKPETDQLRMKAATDILYVPEYEKWVNRITDRMPYIFHVSWWSVYQKMLKYKLHWNSSWNSLYAIENPNNTNPFFDKPFDQVTDDEMRVTAKVIEAETSGHVFHTLWNKDISPKTNGIILRKPIPDIIKIWCDKNKT
jgi:hypothetical protein